MSGQVFAGSEGAIYAVTRNGDLTDATAEYFNPLTAIGYGEPTFAAFYSKCHSVFGLVNVYSLH